MKNLLLVLTLISPASFLNSTEKQEKKDITSQAELNAALIEAAGSDDIKKIKSLLNNGANVNGTNKSNSTALIYATWYLKKEIVKLLLDNGANINVKNNEGKTALIVAAQNQNKEIVELLLKHGADINIKGNNGQTALDYANSDIQELFDKYKSNSSFNSASSSCSISTTSSAPRAPSSLPSNSSSTCSKSTTSTASAITEVIAINLPLSTSTSSIDQEKLNAALIEAADFANSAIKSPLRPIKLKTEKQKMLFNQLREAASKGDKAKVKTLLDGGADINAQDKWGDTALMWASFEGKTEIVEFLLERNADINIKDRNGKTALMWAAKYNRTKIVELLLDHDANIYFKDEDGKTALDFARNEDIRSLFKKFVEYKEEKQKYQISKGFSEWLKNQEQSQSTCSTSTTSSAPAIVTILSSNSMNNSKSNDIK